MSVPTHHDASKVFQHLANQTSGPILDVFGPTVEFLTQSDEFCVIRGVVPPGVTVPLHRHGDTEDFFIISGTQQVLVHGQAGLEWQNAHAGDYVCIPGDVSHAIRNVTEEPAVSLIITTARMGRFFQEIGRPVTSTPAPPTPEELEHFVDVAVKYGYILGSAEENATVGITIPGSARSSI